MLNRYHLRVTKHNTKRRKETGLQTDFMLRKRGAYDGSRSAYLLISGQV